ncbi:MAG: hypothetical protein ED557_03370 [Balneola sp.]|nr:MAG: hypothetical protein ED557_03370 [Balneola sp.]
MKKLIGVVFIIFIFFGSTKGQEYEWEIRTLNKDTVLTELFLPTVSSSTCTHEIPFLVKKLKGDATKFESLGKDIGRGTAKIGIDFILSDTLELIPNRHELNKLDTVYYKIEIKNDAINNEEEYFTLEIPYNEKIQPFDNHILIKISDQTLSSCSDQIENTSLILTTKNKKDVSVGLLKLKEQPIYIYRYENSLKPKQRGKKRFYSKGLVKVLIPPIGIASIIGNRNFRDPSKPDKGQLIKTDSLLNIIGANIAIEDGFIKFLVLETSNMNSEKGSLIFENSTNPISLTSYYSEKARQNHLTVRNNIKRNQLFIKPWDFLEYYTLGDQILYPSDIEITLPDSSGSNQVFLSSYGDLNKTINAEVYSDLLGLSDEANGILQTEVSTKFILNSESNNNSWVILSNSMTPYAKISKFDSSTDSLKIASTDTTIDRLKLLRLNEANFGVGWNVFRRNKIHDLKLDVGLEWARTSNIKLADNQSTDVNQTIYFTKLSFDTKKGKNFGISLAYKLSFQQIWKNAMVKERKHVFIHNFESTLDYYPLDDSSSKIFFRFKPFFSGNSLAQNNFVQVQFGTKIAFSGLLDRK